MRMMVTLDIVVLPTISVVNPAIGSTAMHPWHMQTRLPIVDPTPGRTKQITPYSHRGVGVGGPYGAGTGVHREGPLVGVQARLELAETGGEALIKFPLELFL